jgi:putative flippase GtrA
LCYAHELEKHALGLDLRVYRLSKKIMRKQMIGKQNDFIKMDRAIFNTMAPLTLRNIINRLSVAWYKRALVLKAASFAFVGLGNTIIDFSIFWLTAKGLGWPLVPANILAWTVAVSFSYVMNSFTTFGPESGRTLRWRDYLTFTTSGVAGMVTSTATLFALSYLMPLLIAKLASIMISFAVNFSLSHFVVFRSRRPNESIE